MRLEKLQKEILERQERKEEIRQAIDLFCLSQHDIRNFSVLVDRFFEPQKKFVVCIARQVPAANIEHVAFELFVEWLNSQGLLSESVPLAFYRDSYCSRNPYKQSLVKLKFAARSRQGRIFCERKNVIPKAIRGNLDGRILASIPTIENSSERQILLPSFHDDLREQILGIDYAVKLDLSLMFNELVVQTMLNSNGNHPDFIYVEKDKKEKKLDWQIAKANLNGRFLRPPADWYYFFYLLMFVTGDRGLVSVWKDKEDKEVSLWFSSAISKIKEITGFGPLIINSPFEVEVEDTTSRMLEINRHLLTEEWRPSIQLPSQNVRFFEVLQGFATQLIQFSA